MRILIADDDPGTRLLVSAAVERLGHTVIAAEDGAVAWQRFLERPPDVVITDWDMPGLDGTQLTGLIRGRLDLPYPYVIVLTARADADAARRTMEAGADDLIAKPLDREELERKLIAAERVTGLHRRLHSDARQDALTGLANRHRLDEDLEAVKARTGRYGHRWCCALIDIDRFKAYNDTAGHVAGDAVLRRVARALAATARAGDVVYRYGGEEFLVLLPEQTLESAAAAAGRLRAAVEELGIPHAGGGVVTISAGVAGPFDAEETAEELIARADTALYAAKAAGRNRVEIAVAEDKAEPIRVLIADDDPVITMLLTTIARHEPTLELVGAAADADAAIELAVLRRPRVVILDLDMPGGGGTRAAIEIRQKAPDARIVGMSADDSPAAMLDMSRAGAVGFIVKGAPPAEIIRTIQSAARW
jgi:two-component system chemotaxis response regulator CheY